MATINNDTSWWPDDEIIRVCIVLERVSSIETGFLELNGTTGEVIIGGSGSNVRKVLWQDGTIGMCSEELLEEIE